MIDLAALAIFAAALFWNSASPGPSILALVSRTITRGWKDVLPFLAAMWIGEIAWMTCAIAGLSALAANYEHLFLAIKYLGVAYLFYLAWKMWTSPSSLKDEDVTHGIPVQDHGKMFFAGLFLTLGNPKIVVFYLALVPTLIDLNTLGFTSWALLSVITVLVLAAIDLSYVILAQRARRALKSPDTVRIANRVGAVSLGAAATFMATR